MRELARTKAELHRLVWLDGGRTLVALTRKYDFIVLDAATGAIRHTVQAPGSARPAAWLHLSQFLAVHPNGTQFATAAYSDPRISPPSPAHLWALTASDLTPSALPAGANIHGGVAFAPDGAALVGGAAFRWVGVKGVGAIAWWDLARGEHGTGFAGHAGLTTALAFTADGTHLVSSGGDDYVRVWDVATRKEIGNRKAKLRGRDLALAPDGRGLVVPTDYDGELLLLDPLANKKLGKPRELKGHSHKVTGVAYSPTGERFASVGSDFRLCLWARDGSPVRQFVWAEPLRCVSFAPDGQTVAAGDSVGRVVVYDVD